ncbi:uncharacterized protein LOC135684826 [Rhopilema esculentum]|uniref:uncharacterized protein LOC135684826 n=1 Tax=Rhopilema esculentum TaxID=499914 RepID=UPI0031E23CFD
MAIYSHQDKISCGEFQSRSTSLFDGYASVCIIMVSSNTRQKRGRKLVRVFPKAVLHVTIQDFRTWMQEVFEGWRGRKEHYFSETGIPFQNYQNMLFYKNEYFRNVGESQGAHNCKFSETERVRELG